MIGIQNLHGGFFMAEAKIKKNRYAWVIMIVCCFTSLCGVGLISNTYGVFLPSIVKDLKFGAGQVSLIMTIASWTTIFFYSLGAKVLEKFNVRWITTLAGVIIAACLFSYSQATQIWHFYLTAVVCGAMGAFAGLNLVPLLINRWFVKYKNLAVGIAMMFTGIGGAFFNPLFASISSTSGWRSGYMVAAAISLLFPLSAAIFVRPKPSDLGLQPLGFEDSEEMKSIADQVEIKEYPGIPAKIAFKTLPLYLVFIFVITNAFGTGFNQHWVNYGVTSGFDLVSASTLATVAMLSSAILKIVVGWVNDKFGVLRSGVIFTLFGIVAMIILLANNGKSFAAIQVAAIFYGGTITMTTLMPPMTVREIFGMKDYSTIYPVAFMAMSFGTGLTYGMHGFFIQLTGSYNGSFVFNLVCYVLSFFTIIIAFKLAKPLKEKYWQDVHQAIEA